MYLECQLYEPALIVDEFCESFGETVGYLPTLVNVYENQFELFKCSPW